MWKVFKKAVADALPTNDPKEKAKRADKKRRKEICQRQKKFEAKEVFQTWKIAMGSEIPKNSKDILLIEGISRRNVWMEDNYVFEKIKANFPDQVFHPIEQYALKWQPSGSYFQVIVPLNDPALQENAVLMINQIPEKLQKNVIFLFAPIDPAMNMFAPKVHPASLVSYRTKNEVLKKLSNYYLEAKISLEELQQILTCDFDTWKSALYNYLPADEQVYHTYLNEKPDIEALGKPLHKSYFDGDITLEEYENMKYPDRKKKKEIESLDYPVPFTGTDCIICGDEQTGAIKCYTCDNMVCVDCVKDVFHPKKYLNNERAANKGGQSFLLMHHKYCMKLGELPEISLTIEPDEAYLRQFREETRLAMLKKFIPEWVPEIDDLSPLIPILDEDELRRERLREQQEQERLARERERLARENPKILQELRQSFLEKKKKYEKYYKEMQDYISKVQDKSHTEQFITRNTRLKNELIVKIKKVITVAMKELIREGRKMKDIPGDFYPELMDEMDQFKKEMDEFLDVAAAIGEAEEKADT
jgi:hypothetical protein